MKAALVVGAAALVAWVAQWSFAPDPATSAPRNVAIAHAAPSRAPAPPVLASVAHSPRVATIQPTPSVAPIDAAIADGRWTDADRELLARTLVTLPDDQKSDAIARVMRAANAGQLTLDGPIL